MYSFFIGIDVSKNYLDVAYILFKKDCYLGRFPNSVEGFISIISQLKQVVNYDLDSWFFCFENTGVYSKGLLFWFHENGIHFKEENPIQIHRSLGLKRGKNDKADAKSIARYAYEKRESIESSKPSKPAVLKLKKLILRRDLLVKQRTAMKTSFNMQKRVLDEDLLVLFGKQTENLVQLLNAQIDSLEMEMKRVISEDISMKKNDQLMQSIIGIGPIVSAFVLAYSENFELISDPKKLASFIGIAPFENSSGEFKGKTKVSQLAHKKLKSKLSNAAQSAIRHDPQLTHYFNRKIAEGKHQGSVINAVKNKLVQRIYAVIKRQSPYVKFNYA